MSLRSLIKLWKRSSSFEILLGLLEKGAGRVPVEGLSGSALPYLAAALRSYTGRPLFFVTVDDNAAERIAEELQSFLDERDGLSREAAFFPSAAVDAPDIVRLRLALLQRLEEGNVPLVVSSLKGALELLQLPSAWKENCFDIRQGEEISPDDLCALLLELGYERETLTDMPGHFSLRGGVLDIYPPAADFPFRLELWGETVDSIRCYDPHTQLSRGQVESMTVSPAIEALTGRDGQLATLIEYMPEDTIVFLEEPNRLQAQFARLDSHQAGLLPWDVGRRRWEEKQVVEMAMIGGEESGRVTFVMGGQESFGGHLDQAAATIRNWRDEGYFTLISSDQSNRLVELMAEYGLIVGSEAAFFEKGIVARRENIFRGFRLPELKLAVLTDEELFGWRKSRTRKEALSFADGERLSLLEAEAGDYVVHVQHGIGRYMGLITLDSDGVSREYLHIQYAGNDKLYVPSDQIDRLQKYVAADDDVPRLHSLNSAEWNRVKRRVKEAAREMAHELLGLYARREKARGFAFSPDSPWQDEMESAFPYTETPDQLRAIQDTKRDMESEQPMDRLICGDVGYGKTEVAVRAAFKAVQDGKQVAVLVPTTVLALQHYNTFRRRLGAYPVKVAMLSRFRSPAEQRGILESLAIGSTDIVIGTHRLIQKDVLFKDLGLLVVDEEQRFGVAHKERLKEMRLTVDVLTMTATPIPRTLHMALSGLRPMSVIDTPPEGKMAVRTYVSQYSDDLVRQSLEKELDRGGQVYFVTNRIEGIEAMALRLQQLVPYARIAIAHGQMSEVRLEKLMLAFYQGDYDILVCTTIIENGVDIPNVNTIFLHDADRLGLAQMYQLRGRVGRGQHQAFAYLMYKNELALSDIAQKRLAAIRDFFELGSGMKIAMRDLQIRGAGNILGAQQHGFIQAVGLELYCQLLSEAVDELKGGIPPEQAPVSIDIPLDAFIPASYVDDERLRMEFYRRLACAADGTALDRIATEMADRFGRRPREVNNLIFIVRLKIRAAGRAVRAIYADRGRVVIKGGLPSRNALNGKGGLIGKYRQHLALAADSLTINTDGLTVREWTSLLEAAVELLESRELCA